MTSPQWFDLVITTEAESRYVKVNDVQIHYLIWGDSKKPCLFFVHGYGANAHWWDFIAPYFLEEFCVVAIDLSGMGDSDHRETYTQESYCEEMKAVCIDLQIPSAYFIAHSLGGAIATKAVSIYPTLFKALILVDSVVVVPPDKVRNFAPRRSMIRQEFFYDNLDKAIQSFRLIPPQPCKNDFILKHIAENSFKKSENKWVLKSDGLIMKTYNPQDLTDIFMNVKCPIYIVYGLMSQIFSKELLDYSVYVGNIPPERVVGIPSAMHHLFIDQPLKFIEEIKQFLKKESLNDKD